MVLWIFLCKIPHRQPVSESLIPLADRNHIGLADSRWNLFLVRQGYRHCCVSTGCLLCRWNVSRWPVVCGYDPLPVLSPIFRPSLRGINYLITLMNDQMTPVKDYGKDSTLGSRDNTPWLSGSSVPYDQRGALILQVCLMIADFSLLRPGHRNFSLEELFQK